jgi:hypothetical protein
VVLKTIHSKVKTISKLLEGPAEHCNFVKLSHEKQNTHGVDHVENDFDVDNNVID